MDAAAAAATPVGAMAGETRPELVGKRFLCLAVGEEARPERREGGRSRRGWRAGVIRAVSHRDCRNPDLAVRAPRIPRVRACTPTFSQPYFGVPLAPGSAGQLAVTPLRRARGGFAHVPSRGRRLPACGFPMGAVTELDSLASAGAPVPEGRPRRPFGEAGLRGRGRTLWPSGSAQPASLLAPVSTVRRLGRETYPRGR